MRPRALAAARRMSLAAHVGALERVLEEASRGADGGAGRGGASAGFAEPA
jgi:hypothetical protein